MITRDQWQNIKTGDILISPAGKERTVISMGCVVTLTSTATHDGKTVYNYTDIYKTYSVKIMKPESKKPKLTVEEYAFYYCLKMAGYNHMEDRQIKEMYALAILCKAKKQSVTLLDIANVQEKVFDQYK